jgi:hypothetical protein
LQKSCPKEAEGCSGSRHLLTVHYGLQQCQLSFKRRRFLTIHVDHSRIRDFKCYLTGLRERTSLRETQSIHSVPSTIQGPGYMDQRGRKISEIPVQTLCRKLAARTTHQWKRTTETPPSPSPKSDDLKMERIYGARPPLQLPMTYNITPGQYLIR